MTDYLPLHYPEPQIIKCREMHVRLNRKEEVSWSYKQIGSSRGISRGSIMKIRLPPLAGEDDSAGYE